MVEAWKLPTGERIQGEGAASYSGADTGEGGVARGHVASPAKLEGLGAVQNSNQNMESYFFLVLKTDMDVFSM